MIALAGIVFLISGALYLARPLTGWLFRNEPFRLRRHVALEIVMLGSLALFFANAVIAGFTTPTSR